MSVERPDAQRTRAAWDHYVATGQLTEALLRSHIFRAWSRCAAHGTSPRELEAQRLPPEEVERLLSREHDLIEAALPYMRALSQAAGDELHAAMLGDRDGVVLDVVGTPEHVGAQGFPGPGSVLSERYAGANGIGSPLAERAYFELVGPEHFIEGFHVYTCQGLPLTGPDGTEVVGVLSISVRRQETAERVHEILVCAANGIRAELVSRQLQRDTAQLLRDGAGGQAFERLRQDVVQLQASARLQLEKAARVASEGSSDAVLQLVLASNQLVERFAQLSLLWRELAFGDRGSPQPVALHEVVHNLGALLATEAAIRRVELAVTVEEEPVQVMADPREVSRELFRCLLRALERSQPGDRLDVRVCRRKGRGEVRVAGAEPIAYPGLNA